MANEAQPSYNGEIIDNRVKMALDKTNSEITDFVANRAAVLMLESSLAGLTARNSGDMPRANRYFSFARDLREGIEAIEENTPEVTIEPGYNKP